MAKRDFKIETPRGEISTHVSATGKVVARLTWNKGFAADVKRDLSRAQAYVDSEVLRRCDPLVPFRTGMLKKSGALGTEIGSGEVKYIAPYAKRQYYENKGAGKRGRLWFERMKAAHKESILRGAMMIARGEK